MNFISKSDKFSPNGLNLSWNEIIWRNICSICLKIPPIGGIFLMSRAHHAGSTSPFGASWTCIMRENTPIGGIFLTKSTQKYPHRGYFFRRTTPIGGIFSVKISPEGANSCAHYICVGVRRTTSYVPARIYTHILRTYPSDMCSYTDVRTSFGGTTS